MSYGPNSHLVEEVAEFVRSGRLLAGHRPLREDVWRISDFDEAKELAWEATFGQRELTWTDIREHQMRPVVAATYYLEWYRQADDCMGALLETFFAQVKRRIPVIYRDLIDDVVADLYNIAKARAVLNEPRPFLESLFVIYCAGAWPCGWRGDYPDGQVAAFVPPAQPDSVGA